MACAKHTAGFVTVPLISFRLLQQALAKPPERSSVRPSLHPLHYQLWIHIYLVRTSSSQHFYELSTLL